MINTLIITVTIKNPDLLESSLHVKDLIVTNSTESDYKVHHVQAVVHTNHHLVFFNFQAKKKKKCKKNNNKRILCFQPLRTVKGPPFESKLRDVDIKYPAELLNNLDLNCKHLLPKESLDININDFYQSIVETIQKNRQAIIA